MRVPCRSNAISAERDLIARTKPPQGGGPFLGVSDTVSDKRRRRQGQLRDSPIFCIDARKSRVIASCPCYQQEFHRFDRRQRERIAENPHAMNVLAHEQQLSLPRAARRVF